MWLSKSAQNPICGISSQLGINAAGGGLGCAVGKESGLTDCPENYKWL